MLQMPQDQDAIPQPRTKGAERRLTLRLLNYWQEVKGVRSFPTCDDINSQAIADIWPNCYLLRIVKQDDEPIFDYLGEKLAKFSGVFVSDLSFSETRHQTLLDQAIRYYRDALTTRAPVVGDDEFVRFDGTRIIYRSIILPLSNDQETITHLLGAANGKEAGKISDSDGQPV